MDVVCVGCGEPWDIYHVLHEEPHSFDRDGCLIRCCPWCKENNNGGQSKELIEALKILGEIAEMLDGDIDSFAVWCQDHWPLRIDD